MIVFKIRKIEIYLFFETKMPNDSQKLLCDCAPREKIGNEDATNFKIIDSQTQIAQQQKNAIPQRKLRNLRTILRDSHFCSIAICPITERWNSRERYYQL